MTAEWNAKPKHWCLPEFRRRKHPTVTKRPFSPPSFPARRKRRGRRRRVRNDHDGTNPCKQGFLSSVLVSSFPNRKLNLRFGFFLCKSAATSQSAFGCQHPYPLCPFGTFPPDRGNRPLEGEPFPRKKVTSIWISKAPSIDGRCSTETSCKFGTPVSGGAYQDIRKVTIVWNDARKIGLCLKSDAECTPYP